MRTASFTTNAANVRLLLNALGAFCVVTLGSVGLVAQTGAMASGPVAKFSGCVQSLPGATPAEKPTLVLSTPLVCAKLDGKLATDKLVGHEVELRGTLTERKPGVPTMIEVRSVVGVGKSCSNTCSLLPPHTRGLGKGGETPGKEGGTPGVSAPPTIPPG